MMAEPVPLNGGARGEVGRIRSEWGAGVLDRRRTRILQNVRPGRIGTEGGERHGLRTSP